MDVPKQQASDPPPLPADPDAFYCAGPDVELLKVREEEPKPALELLGPAPFRKPGFPLLGFLATVYDHVSEQVGRSQGVDEL